MSKEISLYGASWCAYCVQLRFYLDKKGYAYTYKNVDDKEIEAEMLEETGGRYLIPTLKVGDRVAQNPPTKMVEEMVNA